MKPGCIARRPFIASALTLVVPLFALLPTAIRADSSRPHRASPAPLAEAAQPSASIVSAEMREQMRQIAHDEVSFRLDAAEKGAIDGAAQATRDADHTMTYVSWMTGVATALVGLMAFIFFNGERSSLSKIRGEALAAVADAKTASTEAIQISGQTKAVSEAAKQIIETTNLDAKLASQAAERISKFDSETQNALAEIDNYEKNLPIIDLPVVMGSPFELPTEEQVMQMEEADILTVIGQRIRPPTEPQKRTQLARAYLALAGYWRNIGNYPRSMARYRRAVELDSACWEAYAGLAHVISELAATPGNSPEAKMRRLDKADEWCRRAETSANAPQIKTRARLGWIADERGSMRSATEYYEAALDYQAAIDFYREAQRLDVARKEPLNTYNFACILAARLRNFPAALDELQTLVRIVRNPDIAKILTLAKIRELVSQDNDFDSLRNDSEYRSRLEALLGF